MRLSSPGLTERGFAAGTGRLVDFDGGRPVMGWMCVFVVGAGYTGRARPVICGARLANGTLGLRFSVALAGLGSS